MANAAGLLVSRCEATTFHRGIGTDLKRCWPEIHDQLEAAGNVLACEYITAQRSRDQLTNELLSVFEKVDVLAMPTSLVTAPKIEDAEKSLTILSRNAIIWSFIGFPALTIPCRDKAQGLPVGLQMVSPPYEENLLVALGTAYELVLSPGLKCIHPGALAKTNITGVWKHILKNWKVHGKTGTKSSMGIGGLMCWTSYTNIWTAVIFIWVLPG